jgi:pantetheine-phosphate adenylyltransferase
MKKTIIYPGTFDPITHGHIDVIRRALALFDKVIVAVVENGEKDTLFSVKERVDFIRKVFAKERRVSIKSFKGLIVRFAQKEGVKCLLRGLRATSDFEYEFQMALTNRKLSKNQIETIFLTPSQEFFYVSSKLIKQVAALKGPLEDLVPPNVLKALREKISSSAA